MYCKLIFIDLHPPLPLNSKVSAMAGLSLLFPIFYTINWILQSMMHMYMWMI